MFKKRTLNRFSENRVLNCSQRNDSLGPGRKLIKHYKKTNNNKQQQQRGLYDPTSKVIYLQTYIGHQHCHEYIQSQCLWACIRNTFLFFEINKPAFKRLFSNLNFAKCDYFESHRGLILETVSNTSFFSSRTNCLILICWL